MTIEMEDMRRRLTAVEEETASLREWREQAQHTAELFGTLDKEVADLHVAAGQQRHVINAIGMTHSEHHAQFLRQADILGGLVLEVGGIRRTQAEHGRVLSEQGRVLNEHGQVLNEHGRMLNEHGQMLREHKQLLTEQSQMLREVLDRLPA
ncbi:hypothetical protein [Actinoallomurus acaciae]|uniref:Uncharacterized protein n=1 Tax=Actinoallomurus acaciae TaxID=502577 RepID=A0ABV5YAF2_9ACTN